MAWTSELNCLSQWIAGDDRALLRDSQIGAATDLRETQFVQQRSGSDHVVGTVFGR
jgi:hypothetical protein